MTETYTITKEMIARINELAHLSKTRQLSASELKEQAELRRQYVSAIKAQVTAQLDNITIVNPDGTTAKPQHKEVPEHDHCGCGCDCGCDDHHHTTNSRPKNNGGYGKH